MTPASAQSWLDDRAGAQGPGIRLGDFELHPGVAGEVGYDSNLFHTHENEEGVVIFRVAPHLYLTNLGDERRGDGAQRGAPPSVAFSLGLKGEYHAFLDHSEHNDIGANGDISLVFNPERPFQFELTDVYSRTIRPFTESGADSYARNRNDAGAQIRLGNSGRVIEGRIGYHFILDWFEGDAFQYDNTTHRIQSGAMWKFFPSTALLWDAEVDLVKYEDASSVRARVDDNTQLTTRVGINGAFTPKLSATAMVGYGAGFYPAGAADYETVVASVDLRWKMSESSKMSLGYLRDGNSAFVGGHSIQDKLTLSFDTMIARVVMLQADAFVGWHSFGNLVDSTGAPLSIDGSTDRSDLRAGFDLSAEYRVQDWLAFTAHGSYLGNFTDYEYRRIDPGAPGGAIPDAAEYQKWEAWGGVRVFY